MIFVFPGTNHSMSLYDWFTPPQSRSSLLLCLLSAGDLDLCLLSSCDLDLCLLWVLSLLLERSRLSRLSWWESLGLWMEKEDLQVMIKIEFFLIKSYNNMLFSLKKTIF